MDKQENKVALLTVTQPIGNKGELHVSLYHNKALTSDIMTTATLALAGGQ